MKAPSVDDYIDKLNDIPQQTISRLHQIKKLDRQVLSLHIQIQNKRVEVLDKIMEHQAKPNNKLRSQIADLFRQISNIHQIMLNISSKKIKLSDQIYNYIDMPTEQLNRDLSIKTQNNQPTQHIKTSKYKRPNKNNQQQFFASEPYYCYCHRPSFGLMVKCQNELCDIEWFHGQCVEEKNLPQKWFCKQCRKNRGIKNGLRTRI